MCKIDYFLVNETGSEIAVRNSTVSELKHHSIIVNSSSKFQVPGSKERQKLLDQLVVLRRLYPDAKILGVSEINPTATYAPMRVNPAMNALRREMSDLP